MSDELDRLRRRVEQLEAIEREYLQVKQIIEHAANGHNLDEYGGNAFLYVYQGTHKIMGANPKALELLGFSLNELFDYRIEDIETASDEMPSDRVTYVQNANQEQIYTSAYRHRDGYLIPVKVYRRVLHAEDDDMVLQYTLEDISLRKKLWHELARREDRGYHFREKLKYLNEINLQLAEAPSFHELCRMAIQLGMEKLGFDRLGIWFHDEENQVMVGTYGVDETGAVRDERHSRWSYDDTYVNDFIAGKNDPFIISDNAPLYNQTSQIIGYGWHIAVPLMYRGRFVGFMTADNFINQLGLKNYQPELLRLYGITIGHLAAHQREQDTIHKLSDAIQNSNSMIAILDEQAVIEFVNKAFFQISGFMIDDVLGHSLTALLPQADYQPLWQAIDKSAAWQGELVQLKKNGDSYETIVSLSPVQTGDKVHHFILVQEDISELKDARKKEFELRLEQARIRMLETFISDIGHEFRTPLSIIRLKSYLAQKVEDSAKKDQLFSDIQLQIDVMNSMVDDLIYIVKLETTPDLKLASSDLKLLVENVLEDLQPIANHKSLQWKLSLPALPSVMCDSDKLMRAVHEIIQNAVQYTPAEGVITVSLRLLVDQVAIRVEDNGIGIAADEMDKIFNRFYRIDQARQDRGTGIGLSIAKRIIEAHHGTIIVESEPESGSIFEIRLPLTFQQ